MRLWTENCSNRADQFCSDDVLPYLSLESSGYCLYVLSCALPTSWYYSRIDASLETLPSSDLASASAKMPSKCNLRPGRWNMMDGQTILQISHGSHGSLQTLLNFLWKPVNACFIPKPIPCLLQRIIPCKLRAVKREVVTRKTSNGGPVGSKARVPKAACIG